MTPIPKDPETRERLIRLHAQCLETMTGVAGCAVVKAAAPGDVTVISGGVLDDDLLRRVLIRMRAQPAKGKLVVVCTKIEKTWRIARLSGTRGVPPTFVDDRIFHDEQSVQHAIFVMRLDEMAATDGMPEHFSEGWKRHDDHWA
jgi:hypothetical protein